MKFRIIQLLFMFMWNGISDYPEKIDYLLKLAFRNQTAIMFRKL